MSVAHRIGRDAARTAATAAGATVSLQQPFCFLPRPQPLVQECPLRVTSTAAFASDTRVLYVYRLLEGCASAKHINS